MSRRADNDSFALIVTETAALGCLLIWSSRFFFISVGLAAAVLWSVTWTFPEEKARLGKILRSGLIVPLLVLFWWESKARVSSSYLVLEFVLAYPILAWVMVSSVRISREADRRHQPFLSVTWTLFAFVLLPVTCLFVLLLLPNGYVFWLATFAAVYGLLTLRFALGIATAIAWYPRSSRKEHGVRAEGAVSALAPVSTDRL